MQLNEDSQVTGPQRLKRHTKRFETGQCRKKNAESKPWERKPQYSSAKSYLQLPGIKRYDKLRSIYLRITAPRTETETGIISRIDRKRRKKRFATTQKKTRITSNQRI